VKYRYLGKSYTLAADDGTQVDIAEEYPIREVFDVIVMHQDDNFLK